MKHTKRYKRTGVGVELFCGAEVIASSSSIFANFENRVCPICGLDVMTAGHSPATDLVWESQSKFKLGKL